MQEGTCVVCGAQFQPKTKRSKYCGKPCVYAAERARQAATGYQARYRSRPEIKAKRVAYSAATGRDYRQSVKVQATCIVCATQWLADVSAKRRGVKYCSPACKAVDVFGGPSTPVPVAHPVRSTPVPRTHPARQAVCLRCVKAYAIEGYGQRYCTKRCQQRAKSARRDVLERGRWVENVPPAAVYERDAWTCKLCDQPPDRDATVPHPLAPTVDHVVPLARGGEHSMANTQAAHFICNSTKGDRVWLAEAG